MSTTNRMPSGNIGRATATLRPDAVEASTEASGAAASSLARVIPTQHGRAQSSAANPSLAAERSSSDGLKPVGGVFADIVAKARPQ